MKKYIIGFLAGAVFMLGTSAFAADIKDLIGRKIQAEVPVVVDGKSIENAIVVDGKSYAPVRSISESAGLSVNIQDKKIVLSSPSSIATGGSKMNKEQVVQRIADLKSGIASLKGQIERLSAVIAGLESDIADPNFVDRGQTEELASRKKMLADFEKQLEVAETELAELEQ